MEVPEEFFDVFMVTYAPIHGYHALAALTAAAMRLGLDPAVASTAAAHALADGIVALRARRHLTRSGAQGGRHARRNLRGNRREQGRVRLLRNDRTSPAGRDRPRKVDLQSVTFHSNEQRSPYGRTETEFCLDSACSCRLFSYTSAGSLAVLLFRFSSAGAVRLQIPRSRLLRAHRPGKLAFCSGRPKRIAPCGGGGHAGKEHPATFSTIAYQPPLGLHFDRMLFDGGLFQMEWTTPSFEEISLNCEISSYSSAEI